MREDLTYIALVLDCSGSMESVRADTIGGVNSFLDEQRQQPGSALVTLALFSADYYDKFNGYRLLANSARLEDVAPLSRDTYAPNGGTALLDAIGHTIDSVGAHLAAMQESERPSKVLVIIHTDGEENRSRQYTRKRVIEMIKHQREKYDWDFVFIGASEKALSDAKDYGFAAQDLAQYAATPEGTGQILRATSARTSVYREQKKMSGVAKRGFFKTP